MRRFGRKSPVLFGGKKTYGQKVLGIASSNLIAYWPMWEASGATADNYEGTAARDGTYSAVTLGQTGIGDGNTCPLFDGTTSFNNIHTASLVAALNKSEGSAAGWVKVANVGVWSDLTARKAFYLCFVNTSNIIEIGKPAAAANDDKLFVTYQQGATIKSVLTPAQSSTGWIHIGASWSIAGDALKFYLNGTQTGSTQTGLVAPSGAETISIIGASTLVPAAVWSGYLAHWAVWTTPLSDANFLSLATV